MEAVSSISARCTNGIAARVFAMQRCEEAEVDSLFKIMELEDEERERLLDMPMSKVSPAFFSRTSEEVVTRTVVS